MREFVTPSTDPFEPPPITETFASVAAREEEAIKSQFPSARKLVDTAYGADWSPDGREVVYGRRSGGIVVLDLDSSEEQVLSETGKDPRWSPGDGQYVTYVEGRSRDETVWVVEAAGGTPRKVADGGYPNWSADGKRIYYREFMSRAVVRSVSVDGPDEEPQTRQVKKLKRSKSSLPICFFVPLLVGISAVLCVGFGRESPNRVVIERHEACSARQ